MKYYIDCEFNAPTRELISIAMVREDGVNIYAVLGNFTASPFEPWVRENVLPVLYNTPDILTLTGGKTAARELIEGFLENDDDPVFITDWPDDVAYLCDLLITGPGTMIDIPRVKFEVHRVDAYPTDLVIDGQPAVQHNAWFDAMALRHLMQRGRA